MSIAMPLHAHAAAETQVPIVGAEQDFGVVVLRIDVRIQHRESTSEQPAAIGRQQ